MLHNKTVDEGKKQKVISATALIHFTDVMLDSHWIV